MRGDNEEEYRGFKVASHRAGISGGYVGNAERIGADRDTLNKEIPLAREGKGRNLVFTYRHFGRGAKKAALAAVKESVDKIVDAEAAT